MTRSNTDVIIIGAGIVGLMIARFLSRYQLNIVVIEKENEICKGTSCANSATIHTGHSVLPGTLKAEMNVKGSRMWDTIAAELEFPFERRGDYVVATSEQDLPALERVMSWGKSNGVVGLHLISGEEMKRREPKISPDTVAALYAENTGMCDPVLATVSIAENAVANGVQILLNTQFENFIIQKNRIIGINTSRGVFFCRWVINTAGVYSDEIMHKAGMHPEFRITPRRSQFFLIDGKKFFCSNLLLSPVPAIDSKGIAVKPTFSQGLLLGANSEVVTDKRDLSVTSMGLRTVWEGALKLIPSLRNLDLDHSVTAVFSGLRATGNAKCKNYSVDYHADFLIECAEEVEGLINIAGIDSPGLTASPAIAIRIIELLEEAGEKLNVRHDWSPVRKSYIGGNDLLVGKLRAQNIEYSRNQKFRSALSIC
jgi:glycerol-3-phosphate dehydrogenase